MAHAVDPVKRLFRNGHASSGTAGFTLLEILIVLALTAILSAVAMAAVSSYYGECRVKSVMFQLADMIKEAKGKAAVDDKEYAIVFDPDDGKISLLDDWGPDGKWNSADDVVIRSVRLGDGLRFGYGTYGPIKEPYPLAETADGITFGGNTLVCNTKLTGSSGTVYLKSSSGAAMALTMNSTDFGYTLRRWNGKKWIML